MTVYAKPIEDTLLGVDLNAGPDKIFRAQTLPTSTTLLSNAFRLSNPMGRNELKVVVETGGTLGADVTFEVQSSSDADDEGVGTYATVAGGLFTAAAGAVVTGDDLLQFIPPRESEDTWYKILVTTTTDEVAKTVNAYIVFVS